jgi:hypothetical protein
MGYKEQRCETGERGQETRNRDIRLGSGDREREARNRDVGQGTADGKQGTET